MPARAGKGRAKAKAKAEAKAGATTKACLKRPAASTSAPAVPALQHGRPPTVPVAPSELQAAMLQAWRQQAERAEQEVDRLRRKVDQADQKLAEADECHHGELAAVKERYRTADERHHGELAAVEERYRTDLAEAEKRHRTDLAEAEQRFRAAVAEAVAATDQRHRTDEQQIRELIAEVEVSKAKAAASDRFLTFTSTARDMFASVAQSVDVLAPPIPIKIEQVDSPSPSVVARRPLPTPQQPHHRPALEVQPRGAARQAVETKAGVGFPSYSPGLEHATQRTPPPGFAKRTRDAQASCGEPLRRYGTLCYNSRSLQG